MAAASSANSWSRNGVLASSPQAIVMLSTRLTGSSTSMICESSRSALSSAAVAPGRSKWARTKSRLGSSGVIHCGCRISPMVWWLRSKK